MLEAKNFEFKDYEYMYMSKLNIQVDILIKFSRM